MLLTTWPIIIDEDFPKGSVKREKLFSEVDESFKITVEEEFVLRALSEIERAVGERDSQTTYISLDKSDMAYPAVNIIYRGREGKLEEVRGEGFLKGRIKLLQTLSGKVPLAVWRRDLVEKFLPLKPAVDGGEVGFLSTVIPNVLVRYYYGKGITHPLISLEVRPYS